MTFQARTHHTSCAAPVARKVNADRSSESRRNNVHHLPDTEWLTNDVAAVTAIKLMIEAILKKTSENSRCETMAGALGWTRGRLKLALNNVRDVLREEKKSVDTRFGFAVSGICYQLGMDPYEVAGLPQMAAMLDAFYVGKAIAEGRVVVTTGGAQ